MGGRLGGTLKKLAVKYQRFMYGRYGSDKLNVFLSGAALALCVFSLFIRSGWISIVVLLMITASIFRAFSKNFERRRRENQAFIRVSEPIERQVGFQAAKFKYRKTHRVYMCEGCKNTLRVPQVKGRIEIKCPKCGRSFIK